MNGGFDLRRYKLETQVTQILLLNCLAFIICSRVLSCLSFCSIGSPEWGMFTLEDDSILCIHPQCRYSCCFGHSSTIHWSHSYWIESFTKTVFNLTCSYNNNSCIFLLDQYFQDISIFVYEWRPLVYLKELDHLPLFVFLLFVLCLVPIYYLLYFTLCHLSMAILRVKYCHSDWDQEDIYNCFRDVEWVDDIFWVR